VREWKSVKFFVFNDQQWFESLYATISRFKSAIYIHQSGSACPSLPQDVVFDREDARILACFHTRSANDLPFPPSHPSSPPVDSMATNPRQPESACAHGVAGLAMSNCGVGRAIGRTETEVTYSGLLNRCVYGLAVGGHNLGADPFPKSPSVTAAH
jgi:hypothetical protein